MFTRFRRKQLLQLLLGLCPSVGRDLLPKGPLCPPGTGWREPGTQGPPACLLLLPWSRWAPRSPAGLWGPLPGHASWGLLGGCPFGPAALGAVPDPVAKVNEETWEQAE